MEEIELSDSRKETDESRVIAPRRVFGRLVSKGERMKLQPDESLGGCWMIRTEFVQKLLEGKLSEVYFSWVPDRPDWKQADSRGP